MTMSTIDPSGTSFPAAGWVRMTRPWSTVSLCSKLSVTTKPASSSWVVASAAVSPAVSGIVTRSGGGTVVSGGVGLRPAIKSVIEAITATAIFRSTVSSTAKTSVYESAPAVTSRATPSMTISTVVPAATTIVGRPPPGAISSGASPSTVASTIASVAFQTVTFAMPASIGAVSTPYAWAESGPNPETTVCAVTGPTVIGALESTLPPAKTTS
jgi:hypothetical protein